MIAPILYLPFPDTAHEALAFYADVFGGELVLNTYADCWDEFDDVGARVSGELAKGPRGGGRSRDEIIRHVYASERHNWWRKVACATMTASD